MIEMMMRALGVTPEDMHKAIDQAKSEWQAMQTTQSRVDSVMRLLYESQQRTEASQARVENMLDAMVTSLRDMGVDIAMDTHETTGLFVAAALQAVTVPLLTKESANG